MVLDVEGSAADVESAFHTSLALFQHPTEARTFYAPETEPVADLAVPVLHVSGLDNFNQPRAKNILASAITPKASGSGPSGSFYGSDLRKAYYGTGSLNGAGQTLAIFAYKGVNMSDITTYFNNTHQTLDSSNQSDIRERRQHYRAGRAVSISQALDIEQAISMARGLAQLRLYVGKNDISIFNQIATTMLQKVWLFVRFSERSVEP